MDLAFNYGYTDGRLPYTYCERCEAILYELTHFSVGLSPTIGVDYSIAKRINVRLEMNMNLGLQFQTYNAIFYDINYPAPAVFFMSYNPINALTVGYKF